MTRLHTFTRALVLALLLTLGASLAPQAAPHSAGAAVVNVSVWPALGTTVTLLDGITTITADGSVLTYTAEVATLVRQGRLLTHDPRPGSTGIVGYPTSTINPGSPQTVSNLFSRAGATQDETVPAAYYGTGNARGGGLWRWDGASTATHNGGTIVGLSTVGRWFRIFTGAVDASWFGAKCDDSADDITAIQAAVDYAISAYIREVTLPSGVCRISHTLQLGKAGAASSVALIGLGPNYNVSTAFQGTVLRTTFSDAPAVNVQGARSSAIRDLTIQGLADTRMISRGLGEISNTTNSDTLDTDWNDSSLNANADSRYAPYAGVAVDGWSGTAPATHYPTTYTAYGQPASSVVTIERVVIRGFMVGLAVQPSDQDGNGDFVTVHKSQIRYNKWAVSVGNGQSRNLSITDTQITNAYCAFTSTHNGHQIGKFGSVIKDVVLGQIINPFLMGSSSQYGPLKVQNLYAEAIWRIGDFVHNTSTETGVEFDSCYFGFHLQNYESRGVPATIITGGSTARVKFSGGIMYEYVSAFSTLGLDDMEIDGTAMISTLSEGSTVSKAYLAAFHNATAGGVIFSHLRTETRNQIKFKPFNIDTLAQATAVVARDGMRIETNRPYGVPAWVQSASTTNGIFKDRQPQVRASTSNGKASVVTSFTQNAAERGKLVLTVAGLTDSTAMRDGYDVGDVIWDDQTGMTFVIRDRSATVLTAEAQNNYKLTGGVYGPALASTAFSTSVGTLYFLNSRMYRPTTPLFVDTTSGSATLASAGRDDGVATFIGTDICSTADVASPCTGAGDRVFIDTYSDNWISPTNSTITATNTGAATMTMGGNAGRTLSRKLLPWFIRRVTASATR